MGHVARETTYTPVSPEVRLAALGGLQRFLSITIEQCEWMLKYTEPGSAQHEDIRVLQGIWKEDHAMLMKMAMEIRQQSDRK